MCAGTGKVVSAESAPGGSQGYTAKSAGTLTPAQRAHAREMALLESVDRWLAPGRVWRIESAAGVVEGLMTTIQERTARRGPTPRWQWEAWQAALTRLAVRRRFGATWRGVFLAADPSGARLRAYEAERASQERAGILEGVSTLVHDVAAGRVHAADARRRRGQWTAELVTALMEAPSTPPELKDEVAVLTQAPLRGEEIAATTAAAVRIFDSWGYISYVPQKVIRRRAFLRCMVVTTTPGLQWDPWQSLRRLVARAGAPEAPLFRWVRTPRLGDAIRAVADTAAHTHPAAAAWAADTFAPRDLRDRKSVV